MSSTCAKCGLNGIDARAARCPRCGEPLSRMMLLGRAEVPVIAIEPSEFKFGQSCVLRRVLKPFAIGETLVTNLQYAQFLHHLGDAASTRVPLYWRPIAGHYRYPAGETARHPVRGVSWQDARAFCQWAGGRLPTELEWELAARHVDGRRFPWGDVNNDENRRKYWPLANQPGPLDEYLDNYNPDTRIYHLVGILWQWTATPAPRGTKRYILKGGFYRTEADELASWQCTYAQVTERKQVYGFRCAANLES